MSKSRTMSRATLVLVLCLTLIVTLVPAGFAGAKKDASTRPGPGVLAKRASSGAGGSTRSSAQAATYRPGELIVRYEPGAPLRLRRAADEKAGAASVSRLGRTVPGLARVTLKDGVSVEQAVATYNRQRGVRYAQPNYVFQVALTPDDPDFGSLWGLDNTGQNEGTPDADIDAPEAWDSATGSSDVVVAVVDTGVDYTHPDLAANMWTNGGEIAGNDIDDDGNGYVDDIYGIDTAYDDSDPMDDYGHGTHCSGTIGAEGNNGIGVAGVNWDVRIMALKFLDSEGFGDTADAITAFEYAYTMGADILSNSWGGGGFDQALYDTMAAMDRLFVFAAGNWSEDTDRWANYPSGFDLPNILAVGASNRFDEAAEFSNFGLKTVDVFAPGEDILSTIPEGGYETNSGTSMATPHVAGVAALLLGVYPTADWPTLKLAIMGSAEPKDSFAEKCLSGARLNADLALDAVAAPPGTLAGTVTSVDGGMPVEGASVAVDSTLFATTDANGQYSIPGISPGTHALVASHPDYLTQVVTGVAVTSGGTTTQDVALELAGKIAGTVKGEDTDLGLGEIQVTAYVESEEYFEPLAYAQTGPDGSYTIGGLVTGAYYVEFVDYSFKYKGEYFDDKPDLETADPIEVTQGVTTDGIDAWLVKYGEITGTVTSADSGEPLAGIVAGGYREMEEWWEWYSSAETDVDGNYTLPGLETGVHRVEFFDPAGDYAFEYYDGQTSFSQATPVDVTLGATTADIDATLETAGRIEGAVTAADGGAPIQDAWVTVYHADADTGEWDWAMGAVTAEDGTYSVGGLATGSYTVEFVDYSGEYVMQFYDGKRYAVEADPVEVSAGSVTPDIDAALITAGKISGVVTDAATHEPLQGIWVNAYRFVDGWWEWVWSEAETDAEGFYTIRGLDTGTYRVDFVDPAGIYAYEVYNNKPSIERGRDIRVKVATITSGINAALDVGGTITGTVTSDEDDEPLPGVWAVAIQQYGNTWQYTMGAEVQPDGTYAIAGLQKGNYRVLFVDPEGEHAYEYYDNKPKFEQAQILRVKVRRATPNIDASLGPAGKISGTVTAAEDGVPLKGIYVTAYVKMANGWEPFWGAETDADGVYTIPGLTTDSYRVEFFDWEGNYAIEYYNGKPTLKKANDVRVRAGRVKTGIDATLEPGDGMPPEMWPARQALGRVGCSTGSRMFVSVFGTCRIQGGDTR